MVSDDALIAARVECLKAAIAYRTPGTTPAATVAIAAQLWDWVHFPIPTAQSDTPSIHDGPDARVKGTRAAGATGKAADRAPRAALPPTPEN